MRSQTRIINNCTGLLDQAIELLGRIDDAVFVATSPLSPRGSIGGHLRHIVDSYQCFLTGVDKGRIEYYLRQRDVAIERNRVLAIVRMDETIDDLRAVSVIDGDRSLLVSTEDASLSNPDWSISSVLRELDYLQNHTVHHYALIAMLLRLHEIDPGPEFGVAPSTLKYWIEQGARAA